MMTKTLIVYTSRTGYTRRIAKALAKRLNADLEEIVPVQPREGPIGYAQSALEALLTLAPAIQAPRKDPARHDLVVIGSPVWFWRLSSPVRTWLMQTDLQSARVACFCTMGGSGAQRVFDAVAALTGKKPVATLALTDGEIDAGVDHRLDEFAQALNARSTVARARTSHRKTAARRAA
jgi:flavodoxin